jgi:thiamine-monophosphate kinase
MLTEGVDFRLGEVSLARIGRKSLAVNLSDLAAMAARPVAAVVALALPHDGALDLARQLYEGMLPLAEEFDLAIAGGDTNCWDGPLVISVTVLGVPTDRGVLTRSGAQGGDAILVTGSLGGSILGRHFDFQPRVAESLRLQERFTLHAGIDCSDGLAKDLSHVCEASGVGAEVWQAEIPISPDAYLLAEQDPQGDSALHHALSDGEDFELILAVPEEEAKRILMEQPLGVPITRIGRFLAGDGMWQVAADGSRSPLAALGFEHGRDS